MWRLSRSLLLGAVLLVWGAAPSAAQDDWGLTRERDRPAAPRGPAPGARRPPAPTDREALARRVQRSPNDVAAWSRLEHQVVSEAGGIDEAVRELEQRVQEDPGRAVERVVLAQLLSSQRRLEQAQEQLAAARQQLEAPELALRHARLWLALGRDVEARAALEAVQSPVASREQRTEALRALAELDLRAGQIAAARERHVRLHALSGPGSFAAASFARALADEGRHGLAADEYVRLAREHRGDARASAPFWRDAARQRLLAEAPAEAAEHAREGLRAASRGAPALRRELLPVWIDAARQAGTLDTVAPELEQQAGSDPALVLLAAGVWRDLGQPERAEALYRRAIRMSPRDGEARLALAQLLSSSGRLEEAVAEYEALVKRAPDQPELVVEMADLLVRLGRADRAREVVAQASRSHPRAAPLHRALAELYVRWEMHERALAELELLTRIEPDEPGHWIALGTLRLQSGDEEGALAAWQHLLKLRGDEADRHATLARVLADHDRLAVALEHMETARGLREADLGYERDYASMLERASRLRDAEAAWQRVLRSEQADAAARREARQHLVVIWKRSGRLPRRIASLEGRFEDSNADLEAGRTLAEALARSGPRGLAQAAEVLEELVARGPDDLESLRALARVYEQLGEALRAIGVLERLSERDPAGAQEHLRRAVEIAQEAYQDERALALARRAVRLFPGSAGSHALLGELYLRRQELELAAASFSRCLALEPERYEVAMALGALEMRRGRAGAARDVYLAVLRAARDDALAGRAASALFQIHVAEQSLHELERDVLPLALSRARPLYRRLLVDTYGAWLGASARRVRAGNPQPGEVERLREVGKRAIRPLLEALSDPDPSQREVALSLLGPMGHPGAGPALLALAREGEGGQQRAEALVALALLRSPDSVAGLADLASGPSVRLRPLAAWALGRVGGPQAVRALSGALGSRDRSVRVFAIAALGHLGATAAAGPLSDLETSAGDVAVRAACLYALTALGAAPGEEALRADLAGPVVLAEAAALALARSPEALAQGLYQRPPALRETLVQLLGVPPPQPLRELPVPEWPVRPSRYLGRLADRALAVASPPDLALLVERLASPTRAALQDGGQVGQAALVMLGGGAEATPILELGRASAARCEAARRALGELVRRLAPELRRLAQAGDSVARLAVLRLWARNGSEVTDGELAAALREGAAAEREVVLRGLEGRPLSPGLRQAVAEAAVRADAWTTRRLAVRALGPPVSAAGLAEAERRLLAEASPVVRVALLEQIAASTAPGARRLLESAGGDAEAAVARRAQALLSAEGLDSPASGGSAAACLPAN